MRFSLDLEIKAVDYYGPYDLYIGGIWVARRKYDGSSDEDMIAEFVGRLGGVVAGNSMWSTDKPLAQEEYDEPPDEDPWTQSSDWKRRPIP